MELSSCVVLLIACLSIAEGVSQTLATAWAQERNQQQPEHVSPCNAFVREANHSDSKVVIGDYLSVVLRGNNCNASVSEDLIAIFTYSKEAGKRREDLKETLLNLCSAFVDAISTTANNLTYGICKDDRDLLSTESLNQDFCNRSELETEKSERQLEEGLEGMKLTSISTEVGKLVEISDSEADCAKKCGEGDGKILCNAFYSLASWLNPRYQEVYGKSDVSSDVDTHMDTELTAEQTNTDSDTNPKPPVPAPSTPSFDDAALVSKLLPFLSLSLPDLRLLARQNSATLTDPESTLSFLPDTLLLEDVKKLKHAQTTLRVFYLAKAMYNQLYVMSERSLKYYVNHTEGFTYVTGFPTKTAELDFGDDLSMVLAAMVNYRDILFTSAARELVNKEGQASGTKGSVKQGGNTDDKKDSTDDKNKSSTASKVVDGTNEATSTRGKTPSEVATNKKDDKMVPGDSETQKQNSPGAKSDESSAGVMSDNKSLLENIDLRGFLLAMGLKDDNFTDAMLLADSKSEDEALEIISMYCKKFSSMFHRDDITPEDVYELIKNDPIVREGLGLEEDTDDVTPDTSLDLGRGEDEVEREELDNLELGPGETPPLIPDGDRSDEEQAAVPGPGKEEQSDNVDGLDLEDKEERSYGPYHFLGAFLVVAVIVVVAYLCMHNRKKLREGVNGYVSGAGKRRRARQYKPLATSEA